MDKFMVETQCEEVYNEIEDLNEAEREAEKLEEILRKRVLSSPFEYRVAKDKLKIWAKNYRILGNGPVSKMQILSNCIDEWERK